MSMLAERKQKQRWSLNPRGKQWSEDSSKFGQKLMERMGWKHGKGLGANEDGLTENVKLNYKNDQKGMGYKETEQWTEHEDHFTQLLNTLNGDSNDNSKNDEVKVSSLHEKAENVKTRINYHKFTKGKDLSRYSEKDLANIFGRKNLKKEVKNKEKIEIKDDVNEKEGNLINKGSITDYFKRKLPQFGKFGDVGVKIGNNGVLTKEGSDTESEKCFGFGFNNDQGLNEGKKRSLEEIDEFSVEKKVKIDENNETILSKDEIKLEKKKKKKNRLSETFISYSENDFSSSTMNEELKNNCHEESEVKKRKKKLKLDENGMSDCVKEQDIKCEEVIGEKDLDGDEMFVKKKKKCKKNKKENENLKFNNEDVAEIVEIKEEPNLTSKKKKKRKEKDIKDLVERENETVFNEKDEIVNEKEEIVNDINITSKKKKKKLKDNEIKVNSDLNSSNKRKLPNEDNDDVLEPPVKKKKSKKSKNNPQADVSTLGIINPSFDPNFNPQQIDLELRKRTKVIIEYENDDLSKNDSLKNEKSSKKSKSEKGIVNPSFEDLLPTVKNKSVQNGIDNPTLNVLEDSDLTLNVVTTPILKSERSISRLRKSVRFSKSNEEHIIPNNYMRERNELFDINTLVVEESIKEELKNKDSINNGFVNNGFDIRAIDKLSFFETDEKGGIDNPCFQPKGLDDKVNELSQRVENFEAKLDNDINEYKSNYQEVFVGCNDSVKEHIAVSEGVRLSFSNVTFGQNPSWMSRAETTAKKSYKHLIKGDIIVAFKSSNLHEITGYGVEKK
nr:putative leucine-rich repeat-containing protein DDB_G0290503 [Onthophagus taurus]